MESLSLEMPKGEHTQSSLQDGKVNSSHPCFKCSQKHSSFCNNIVFFQFINLISFKIKLKKKNSKRKQKPPNNTKDGIFKGRCQLSFFFLLHSKRIVKCLMNYCLDDEKCHKDDLLIPDRVVYLELLRETDNTIVSRQRVNGACKDVHGSLGSTVDEEHVKLMDTDQVSPVGSMQQLKPPSINYIPSGQCKYTTPCTL